MKAHSDPQLMTGVAGLAATWSIRSGDTLWPQAGDGVQAWLLPDLSGLVTPFDPCRWLGAGLAATWSIRSGDTLWPPAGDGVQAWLLPDLSGLVTPFEPQQARGCRPGCYLIYPVWWHPLSPSRRGGAGLAATWSIRSGDTLWPPAGEGVQAWLQASQRPAWLAGPEVVPTTPHPLTDIVTITCPAHPLQHSGTLI